jgi:NAD(P)-dependent dehydrogenase (short-subunit alcohol dehydrogenase family)
MQALAEPSGTKVVHRCAVQRREEFLSRAVSSRAPVRHTEDNSLDALEEWMSTIADKTVLVTGANRGIGQALVEEALRRGAKQVYAGSRRPLTPLDDRVTPLNLDVTSAAQIQAAVDGVETLDVLVNNAGLALYAGVSDRAALEQQLAVNLFGTYDMTQAFLPLLTDSRGAIVNVLSLAALAAVPFDPGYSISKAATLSLSQSLRALLAGQGVSVHAVMSGPVDTDMARGLEIPKSSPESVARAILDGLESGEEDIFPDPMSNSMAESWRGGATKALERQMATYVAAPAPVES